MENVSFEIIKHIGVLKKNSSGWTKELNLVSWNGGVAKYDIRDWNEEHNQMSRGITLHEDEKDALLKLLND